MNTRILFDKHFDIIALFTIGFLIRLYFLFLPFHGDEFCDIMASLMITEKGFPELPSGSWWLSGGPMFYLEAPFIKLFGPLSVTIRIPSLILSTLSILSIYKLGSIVSKRAAVIACVLWMVDLGAVEWGSYARQYAIYPFCYFTSLYFFYKASSDIQHKIKNYCIAFMLFFVMVFSHAPSICLIPSMVIFNYFFQIKRENYEHIFRLPILLNTIYISALFILISASFYKLIAYLDPGLLYSASEYGSLIFWPETMKDAIARVYYFAQTNFFKYPARLLSFICATFYASYWSYKWLDAFLTKQKTTKNLPDFGMALSLMLFSGVVIMAYFYYNQPGYVLGLAGIGYVICGILLDVLLAQARIYIKPLLYAFLSIFLVFICFFNFKNISDNSFTPYFDAYEYVVKNAEVGDACITSDPLFFVLDNAKDKPKLIFYQYCSQKCGLTLVKKEGKLYDRFMGGRNLKTISDFKDLFAKHKRVWFVFFKDYMQSPERYPLEVTNYILGKMKKVYHNVTMDIYKYEQEPKR